MSKAIMKKLFDHLSCQLHYSFLMFTNIVFALKIAFCNLINFSKHTPCGCDFVTEQHNNETFFAS